MEIKHGGCWYCASKKDEILTVRNIRVIDNQGKESSGSYALCSVCVKAPVLDQRVPMEQRKAA